MEKKVEKCISVLNDCYNNDLISSTSNLEDNMYELLEFIGDDIADEDEEEWRKAMHIAWGKFWD